MEISGVVEDGGSDVRWCLVQRNDQEKEDYDEEGRERRRIVVQLVILVAMLDGARGEVGEKTGEELSNSGGREEWGSVR